MGALGRGAVVVGLDGLVEGGVGDAGVVDGLEAFGKDAFGIGDVAEGDGALAEIAALHLAVDDAVHQFGDGLVGVFLEAAGGGFDGIGHHEDGLLAGVGVAAGIGEGFRVDLVGAIFVASLDVEVFHHRRPVVGDDKLAEELGDAVLFGQADTLGDVGDDDLGRPLLGELVVGVDAALIFGEIGRIEHFSDVVVEGGGADELHVGTNFGCHFGRQTAHLLGVDVGAVGLAGHAADEGGVGVVHLDEGDARGESEEAFDEIEQGIGEEEGNAVDADVPIPRAVDVGEGGALGEVLAETERPRAEGDDEGRAHQLGTLGEVADGEEGDQSAHELGEEEEVVAVERDGGEAHHEDVDEEGRARVHKHADDEGHHRKGDDVDGEELVGHQQRGEHGEEGDQTEDEIEAVGRGVEVAAEEVEEDEQEGEKTADEADLSAHHTDEAAAVVLAVLAVAAEGLEDGVLPRTDALAAVDDALAGQYHAGAGRYGREGFFAPFVGAQAVVDEVGDEVFVEVEARHDFARELLLVHGILIGRAGGEEGREGAGGGRSAAHHADAFEILCREVVELFGVDHAAAVDVAEHVEGVLHIGEGDAVEGAAGIVALEVLDLLLPHLFARVEVGVELLEHAVALDFELVGRLVDGKFEGGDEGRIAPGLPNLVGVAEFGFTRQGEDDAGEAQHEADAHGEPKVEVAVELHREEVGGEGALHRPWARAGRDTRSKKEALVRKITDFFRERQGGGAAFCADDGACLLVDGCKKRLHTSSRRMES